LQSGQFLCSLIIGSSLDTLGNIHVSMKRLLIRRIELFKNHFFGVLARGSLDS